MKSQQIKRMILAFAVTLLCYFIFTISADIYVYTDNITVAVVMDGLYGANNFCQYQHPLLALIIKALTPLVPSADMFTVFVHCFVFLTLFSMAYVILDFIPKKKIRSWQIENYITAALCLLIILFFSMGMNLWNVNYTVQAAGFVFTGMIILFLAKQKRTGVLWIVVGTTLVAMGFMLRVEAALLFVPFFGLECVASVLAAKDRLCAFKHLTHYLLPCIIIVVLLLASQYIFNAREPYATAKRYNANRTITEDYPMAIWNAYDRDFSGIEETEYNAARSWVLADTDALDADKIELIARIGSDDKVPLTNVRVLLREMWKMITHTDIQLIVLFGLTVLLFAWNLINSKNKWLLAETICCIGGAFIILAYFTHKGRAPYRVWQCVLFAANAVLTLIAIKQATIVMESNGKQRTGIGTTIFSLLLCVVLYFSVGQAMAYSHMHLPYTALTSKSDVDDSGYGQTFEGDALYIWPNWYAAVPDYFDKAEKLPTQRVIDHNIPLGDWTYQQPYFTSFLERVNAVNPMKALVERPNTYPMEGNEEFVQEFLQVHYGDDIVLVETGDEINGDKVLKAVRDAALADLMREK